MDENRQGQLHVWRAGQHITIETEAIDVGHFIAREHGLRVWDLLIGQAFLDLTTGGWTRRGPGLLPMPVVAMRALPSSWRVKPRHSQSMAIR